MFHIPILSKAKRHLLHKDEIERLEGVKNNTAIQHVGELIQLAYHWNETANSDADVEQANIILFGNRYEYWLKIGVGTPPVFFDVQADTGSSFLHIPDKQQNSKWGYDYKKSRTSSVIDCFNGDTCSQLVCFNSTSFCFFNITYGDSSSSEGYVVQDIISFVDMQQNPILNVSTMFGSATLSSATAFVEGYVSGIFGLSYGSNRMAV